MQPYFAPYIGYFQLMNSADKFVVYDNIKYTKKGWINRNRFLREGRDEMFTIPILGDSDSLDIRERRLSENFIDFNKKTLRRMESAYSKAPYFEKVFETLNDCFLFEGHTNLFEFNLNSLLSFRNYLKIETEIVISSSIDSENSSFKGKDRVLDICKKMGASSYLNPVGGLELYNKTEFNRNGIDLQFLKPMVSVYNQFNHDFVPWLSIIDVMMFNSPNEIKAGLNYFELL